MSIPQSDEMKISLSFSKFTALLAHNDFEIVHCFSSNDLPRFFELKSSKYRSVFFVRISERFAMRFEGEEIDASIVYPTEIPNYKKLYIDLLSEGVSSAIIACKEYLCHIHSKDGNSAYTFTAPDTPHVEEVDAIRELENEIGAIREEKLKVEDKVKFIESHKTINDDSTIELYDSDGTEIRDLGEIIHLSPKKVYLPGGKIVEYSMIDSDFDVGSPIKGDGSPRVASTKIDASMRENIGIDIGEVYPCYDVDEFFSGLKDGTLFEDVLLREHEKISEIEIRMREKKVNDIERSLDEYRVKVSRSVDAVRESETEIKRQMERLLGILSSCKKVYKDTGKPEQRVVDVEAKTKRTLDELTLELAGKRDDINAILSDYQRRISRIFQ